MILVTGAGGQLGQELAGVLKEKALFLSSEDLDITNVSSVEQCVAAHSVQTIINCAAYTAVDKAEDEKEKAFLVNAGALERLAILTAKKKVTLVHMSTDYVFDGKQSHPYTEADKTNPLSVYGKSKLAGEKAIFDHAKTAVIIRTGWLYSAHKQNFVKTIARLGSEREMLRVVFDQVGTPTFARDLAGSITKILPQIKHDTVSLYHYANEGVCSWYDLAHEITGQLKQACKVVPIESVEYPTKAVRPQYSVLNKKKIKTDFNLEIPHWKDSLALCLKEF